MLLIILKWGGMSVNNKNFNCTEGERLRDLRKILGYTQEKMSEELGISESLYKKNENGKLPISNKTAKAIEKRFGTNWEKISHGEFRKEADVWTQVLECSETDKIKILFRLLTYFFSKENCSMDYIVFENVLKCMTESNDLQDK